jgi:Protein of unknown function (DUF4242)
MPLFMDIHNRIEGGTPEGFEAAHQKDLEVQARYGVRFIRYWYDEKTGKVFCLSEAPDRQSIIATHRASHGHEPDEVFEVVEGL